MHPTDRRVEEVRSFLFEHWKALCEKKNRQTPLDLSGACRLSALFAAEIFGGTVRGSFWHAWCELPSGKILDINADCADVQALRVGQIPHELWGITDPEDIESLADRGPPENDQELYEHNEELEGSSFEREEMARAARILKPWINQWHLKHSRQPALSPAA